MDNIYRPLRYMFGPARNGTSHVQRSLCQSFGVRGIYEPMRYYMRWGGDKFAKDSNARPPVRQAFLHAARGRRKIVIAKDVINIHLNDDRVMTLLNGSYMDQPKPLFVFRDPLSAANSIKKRGWYPTEAFIRNYELAFNTYRRARDAGMDVLAVTHEQFIDDHYNMVEKIGRFWGAAVVAHDPVWQDDYFATVHYEVEQQQEVTKSGAHEALMTLNDFEKQDMIDKRFVLDAREQDLLVKKIGPLYREIFLQHGPI